MGPHCYKRFVHVTGFHGTIRCTMNTRNVTACVSNTHYDCYYFYFADKPYDTRLEASIPDNVAIVNSSLILNCTAKANPPVMSYKIYHNGILVSNSSTGIHNITHTLAEHNGSYVCIPYNEFGEGERATLNVSFTGVLFATF